MAHNWIGSIIGGRYQIEDILGQGGMSAVYRAYDPNLRRKVAVKLIHPHLATDPNFIARFKEEAAAVARLRHPNIVQVHDFNADEETYYMVMEFLVGETLQTRLKRLKNRGRQMSLSETIDISMQLCNAVGYAHNHEMIHRDIKPANIMLDVNGRAILMDFGIVKIIGGDTHTATGATVGTAMYMSPEQIRSERVDERSDIYSLGVTLYEMVSGRPPYQADSAMTLMMMVLNDPLPDLREIRTGIPESLLSVVNTALAKEPADRFQTMTEMAASLINSGKDVEIVPAATLVDEVEIITDEPPRLVLSEQEAITETEKVETALPQIETVRDQSYLQEQEISESPPIHDRSTEQVAARSHAAPFKSKLGNRQLIQIVSGLLLILVIALGGIVYLNYNKTPSIMLTPIAEPNVPLNAQNAEAMVNLGTWETDSRIETLEFSPDGSLIGTANNREEKNLSKYRFYAGLWRVQTGDLQYYLLGHSEWVSDVAFSAQGDLFGTTSDDRTLILWETDDGSLISTIAPEIGALSSIDFSSNSLLFAAGSTNGILGFWDQSKANLLRTLQEYDKGIIDVDFSPDNQLIAASYDDNTILIWKVSNGSMIHSLQGHQAPARRVSFSPDGTLLASASEDHTIGVWQVSDGSLLTRLYGHSDWVNDVAFSPDGTILASGSGDGTLRLWQVSDGQLLKMLAEDLNVVTSLAFSPNSTLMASGTSDGLVQFWGISESIPLEAELEPAQP
jgi:serine/threonine protein kinase